MIEKRKIVAIALSTILATSILTGCGAESTDSTVSETKQTESSAKTANVSDYKGSSFTGKVTAVNGNEITVSIGGGPMRQRPDFDPDDDSKQTPPDFNSEDGNMPTPPDFDSEDGSKQAPPDFNSEDGNMPTPPNMNSDSESDNSSSDKPDKKEHDSKTITFTIDDESVLEDITMSDIEINSMLTISVDDSGKISKIAKIIFKEKPDTNDESSL